MTEDEKQQLRAETLAYINSTRPAPEPLPMPAAAPTGLTEAQKQNLADNWVSYILEKNPTSWTPEEKAAVRVASGRALWELGYR